MFLMGAAHVHFIRREKKYDAGSDYNDDDSARESMGYRARSITLVHNT